MLTATARYRSGEISVDADAFEISRSGKPLSMEPKAVRVILYLISNRNRVVSKDELLREVWNEATVSENSLTRVIAMLRKALGDDAREARYIATIPTLGYRWIAEVEELGNQLAPPRADRRLVIAAMLVCVIAGGAWTVAGRFKAQDQTVYGRAAQVTSSEQYDSGPVFAPDGSAIAYASKRNGSFEILVRPLAVGAREIQITSDGQQNLQPAWSPDGKHIAYHSMRRRGIRVVPALGGQSSELSSFGSSPAWTANGGEVLFQSQAAFSVAYVDKALMTPCTIWKVSAQGGRPQQLSEGKGIPGRHISPQASPDGRRIVFVAQDDLGGPQIWTADERGDSPRLLISQFAALGHPHFSPDGRYVVFAAGEKTLDTLYRISAEGGKPSAPVEELMRSGQNSITGFSLSADGRKLVYCSASLRSNLWSLAIDSAHPEVPGEEAPFTQDTSLRNSLPAISPDGKRVAWFVSKQGMPGKVWIKDIAGGEAFPLTPGMTTNSIPRWMPDGNSIVYGSKGKDGRIWKVVVGGGTPQQVQTVGEHSNHLWISPDGANFVFDKLDGGVANLWRSRLNGTMMRQLSFEKDSVNFPVWSPDGKWIAAGVARGDSTMLGVIPADGGPIQILVEAIGQSWAGSWSPDSKQIVYAAERGGVWNLNSVELATRKTKALTRYGDAASFVRFPAWSPSGDKIIFEKSTMTGNIFLLNLQLGS